jgi:serine/threonine protein kinase/Flp pilus assembly protein TadD
MSESRVAEEQGLESLVGRLADEFLARQEVGEQPDVEEYVARHPQAADLLRKVLASLQLLGASLSGAGPTAPGGEEAAGTLGDFRILREAGRGGMGVVYEAEQISLGRRVALKVLPFAATMDPRHLQRFHNEARAAASLEHPHIVPVYGVGCERGVHYYAMKFIDGQPLTSLLRQHRADPVSGGSQSPDNPLSAEAPNPPEARTTSAAAARTQRTPRNAAAFRQVAALGIQAAEALEHAHSIGVVHRDIKPANLMIDAQGALWVTDFGLARTAADAGLTMTGDVLGTLRYMSPEQALAKHGLVDHHTDIYSLGVTLYELLTGTPALDGKDREEILNAITLQERRPPRALDAAIPRDLETIVLKAMEKSPTDRYATAQEMAADLNRFLKDEPIRARRPALWLRLRKWGRRHRPLMASLAAGLLTLLAVGVLLAFAYQRRLTHTEQAVTAALVQVETLVEEGDKLIDQPERWQATARLAQSAQEKAEALLAAGAATPSLIKRAGKDRAAVAAGIADSGFLIELSRIRLEQATLKQGQYDVSKSARSYAKLLGDYGVDIAAPESAAQLIRGSRLHEALITALEDWRRWPKDEREREQLEQVLQAVDPTDGSRTRWREAVARRDGPALVKMATELATQPLPTTVACSRANDLMLLKEWAAAERLLKAAQAHSPGDFWLNHGLGEAIYEQGPARAEEAVGYLRVARALPADCAAVHVNLGAALQTAGKLGEAIACFRTAIALNRNLASAQNNLGVLLLFSGQGDEAIACFRTAIAIDPNRVSAHHNLGNAVHGKGREDEAIACYRRAIKIDPDDARVRRHLGDALCAKGDFEGGITEYREARRLSPKDPGIHYKLGHALHAKGDLDGAIAENRAAIRLKQDFSEAHCNLGQYLMEQGQFAEALSHLRRGHELGSKDPRWPYPSRQWIEECELFVKLDGKLPHVLSGQVQPADAAECLALAQLCRQPCKSLYRAAVRFYADAFAHQRELAEDLQTQVRYNAACAAALAGCGQGKDGARLAEKERAHLRHQALAWLQADLTAYRRLLEKEPDRAGALVRNRMKDWQQDTDFAGVRGPKALARLPEAERPTWRHLWHDVADMLNRSQGEPTTQKKFESQ